MEDIKETQTAAEETEETVEVSSKAKKPKEKKKTKDQQKIEALEAEIIKMQLEFAQTRESYLAARADLENTQKRVLDAAINDKKYAGMKLVSELINPVDMIVRASSMQTEDPQMKNFLIGFQMLANQIVDIMKKDGLTEIEAKEKAFDPNVHQAISKEHVEGVEPGMVLEVLQTGYKYKDRIIRPAMVKVSE